VLAWAYAMSKTPNSGYGLPPLEDLLQRDAGADERAARRAAEAAKQRATAEQRVVKVDRDGRAYGTGRRKEATAQVWLTPGAGTVVVNARPLDDYFVDYGLRSHVLRPFVATGTLALFDVLARVEGGGTAGQAQAVGHGVARALQAFEPALRPALRGEGLLTRDSRVVERKKPGKAKARKSFQWVKR